MLLNLNSRSVLSNSARGTTETSGMLYVVDTNAESGQLSGGTADGWLPDQPGESIPMRVSRRSRSVGIRTGRES